MRDFVRWADGQVAFERDVPLRHLAERVADRRGFFWLDVEGPGDEDFEFLMERFTLHPVEIDHCKNPDARCRIDDFHDHLFMVFRGMNHNPGEHVLDMIELHIFLGQDYLITVHDAPMWSIKSTKEAILKDHALVAQGPDSLMYNILDAMVDNYFPVLDDLDERIDEIEGQLFEDFSQEALSKIFAVKKEVLTLRRLANPQRELLNLLTSRHYPQIRPETVFYLRDVYDHMLRILEMIENFRDLLMAALDAYISQVSNRLNRVMTTLSIVATILLPLSFLTGVFGMNFEIMPGIHRPDGFYLAVGGMALLALALIALFRWKRWM